MIAGKMISYNGSVIGESIKFDKPRKISDRLSEVARTTFVGRQNELSFLSDAIHAVNPPFFVAFIHGPGGIGKSRFLHALLYNVDPKIRRLVLDCREIEPTPQGFQGALGAALEMPESEPGFAQVIDRLRIELDRFQGREVDTAGDGFFATFDKPTNGIQCASAIRVALGKIGINIRVGLHLGECEVMEDSVSGVTVHIGARVAAKAEIGEIFISSTLKDAMAGSDIRFEDRGSHKLKGIPGTWNLFSVKGD